MRLAPLLIVCGALSMPHAPQGCRPSTDKGERKPRVTWLLFRGGMIGIDRPTGGVSGTPDAVERSGIAEGVTPSPEGSV